MVMKKTYFKPEVDVVDIVINSMILINSIPEGDGEYDGEFTNRHRGEWGNVWAN